MTDAHENYISLMKIGSTDYYVKDAEARSAITTIEAAIRDGAHFLGKVDTSTGKTTALKDGDHTKPIYIVGKDTAVAPAAGDFVFQTNGNTTIELVWDGVAGDNGEEGADKVEWDGTWREFGSTGTLKAFAFVDEGTFTYTPAGSISKPDITVTPSSDSFDNLAVAVGTGADAETLTFTTTSKTFLTGASAALDNAPAWTGTEATVTVSPKVAS